MAYHATLRAERFNFADLRELLAKANEQKSEDQLAGIAATSEQERVAAKIALADVPVSEIIERPVIDPDQDDVSRLLLTSLQEDAGRDLRSKTVGELREWLLDDRASDLEIQRGRWGWTPEVIAAVANRYTGFGARQTDWKPVLCAPSQKGLFADSPQRQSAIAGLSVEIGYVFPSTSSTRTTPSINSGPLSRTRMETSAMMNSSFES